jgi:O-acetyl-ADP-ribose deacetylase (regulator of RNase III)
VPGRAGTRQGCSTILPARWVFHTAGPIWQGGDHHESDTLAGCYRNSLALSAEIGAITGAYRYPIHLAAPSESRSSASTRRTTRHTGHC